MRRYHPYSSHVRLLLLLTLLGSLSALFLEVAAESSYLITSQARPDADIARLGTGGPTTALALK